MTVEVDVTNTEEEEVVEQVVDVDPYEEEARRDNWVPKEEWNGPEEAWVDAKTFVERGKQINAILKANNERLIRQLDEQKKQMEGLKLTAEEFKQFIKDQAAKRIKVYEDEIANLKAEKRVAVTRGDGDLVVEIDDRIEELREERAAAREEQQREFEQPTQEQTQQPVTPAPEVEEWVSKNAWYVRDSSMQYVANKLAEDINRFQPDVKGKAFFDLLDKELETRFTLTALGREKKMKPRNPVEGSRGSIPPRGGKEEKSFDDLPPEAKEACDRFVREGLFKNREAYVAEYEWD